MLLVLTIFWWKTRSLWEEWLSWDRFPEDLFLPKAFEKDDLNWKQNIIFCIFFYILKEIFEFYTQVFFFPLRKEDPVLLTFWLFASFPFWLISEFNMLSSDFHLVGILPKVKGKIFLGLHGVFLNDKNIKLYTVLFRIG